MKKGLEITDFYENVEQRKFRGRRFWDHLFMQ